MTERNNGGPAFPSGTGWNSTGEWVGGDSEGMTLRDYFAAKAMQGIISDPDLFMSMDKVSDWAYRQADAMLEARKT